LGTDWWDNSCSGHLLPRGLYAYDHHRERWTSFEDQVLLSDTHRTISWEHAGAYATGREED